MNSLPLLRVPKRLVVKKQEQGEAEKEAENQTDQEKSVLKRTAALIQVSVLVVYVCVCVCVNGRERERERERRVCICGSMSECVYNYIIKLQELKGMSLPKVVLTSQPATVGESSPREQLSNQVARISQLQRRTIQVRRESCLPRA